MSSDVVQSKIHRLRHFDSIFNNDPILTKIDDEHPLMTLEMDLQSRPLRRFIIGFSRCNNQPSGTSHPSIYINNGMGGTSASSSSSSSRGVAFVGLGSSSSHHHNRRSSLSIPLAIDTIGSRFSRDVGNLSSPSFHRSSWRPSGVRPMMSTAAASSTTDASLSGYDSCSCCVSNIVCISPRAIISRDCL